jgi:hypothetical protein
LSGPEARQRAEAMLAVAEIHGTGIPSEELDALLPTDRDGTPTPWQSLVPGVGSPWVERAGRVFRTPELAAQHDAARAARGERFLGMATAFVDGPLGPVRPLIRCLGVTGSVAYGEPSPGDDLDFLVITRSGAVWPFLLYTYLAVRRQRRQDRGREQPSAWCFNYVLDDEAAAREYGRPQGFQFAREALSVRPIRGEGYYRELLGGSAWMRGEAPRLFGKWVPETDPRSPSPPLARAPWPLRVLNRLLHPMLGAYLQLTALRDNHRLTRAGHPERRFEIVTRPDRVEVRSEKFAQIAAMYPEP